MRGGWFALPSFTSEEWKVAFFLSVLPVSRYILRGMGVCVRLFFVTSHPEKEKD